MGRMDAFDAAVGPRDDSALADAMDRRQDEIQAACWNDEVSPYEFLDESDFDRVLMLAVQCAAPDADVHEVAQARAELTKLIRLRVELHALEQVEREFKR